MFRPPGSPPDKKPPRLSLPSLSPALLLPSERKALGLVSPTSLQPAPIITTNISPPSTSSSPKKKSRNSLFSLDWSPVASNVPSRASTPPVTPTAPGRYRADSTITSCSISKRDTSFRSSPPLTPPSSGLLVGQGHAVDHSQPKGLGLTTELPITPTSPNFSLEKDVHAGGRDGGAAMMTTETTAAGQSDNPVLDSRQAPRLRLETIKEYLLGEGRHASVYLGSIASSTDSPATSSLSVGWTLCAAKRVLGDRASQLAGLGEAFVLSKLAAPPAASRSLLAERGSAFILKLYGVKDERDGVESMGGVEVSGSAGRKAWEESSTGAGIGIGRPSSYTHVDARASSEQLHLPATRLQRRSLRRQNSFTATLSPPIGSPSVEQPGEFFSTFAQPPSPDPSTPLPTSSTIGATDGTFPASSPLPASSATVAAPSQRPLSFASSAVRPPPQIPSTPRIILMLEYCPFGHALSFARQFPERMHKRRWLEWARQLVAAVAWAHERGVLHADIKPQNVLVASDLSIRLADFGMSSFLPSSSSSLPLPTDPIGLGTPAYFPPEFVRPPPSPYSHSADIFTLGVTLSVLISGVEPYAGMRAMERMIWIGRGAYWDWEERRREGEDEELGGVLSRAGSVRSARSGGRSRAGSGAGASLLSRGRRSESVESERSTRSATGGMRNSWTLAALSKRLLAPDQPEDETATNDSAPPSPQTPSSATFASSTPSIFVPPSSPPPLNEEELSTASLDDPSDEEEHVFPSGPTTYADGTTPLQYFLNGLDVVPEEVRRLIRAMTSAKEAERPTASEVLSALDKL